ncbi:O-antigen ligase family protein [Candidatus Merdisoma sp. JLR.KK006]|uniref:O-antigen ligase family protein n=1 Tax=Candidatus Merdisoma sp. JLR.KK006 TaxID=3112626 RepID=UPI002FF1BF12
MKVSFRLNDEERICNLLGMLFLSLYIVNISPGFEEPLGIPHAFVSMMMKIVLGLGFFSCIDVIFRRFKKKTLIYCLITVAVIFINTIFFPSNNIVFKNTAVYFLVNCLLPMIFFAMVRDFQLLKQKLLKISEIIAILTIIVLILKIAIPRLGGQFSLGYYSMGFGYACLVPMIFLMLEFVRKPNFKYGLYIIVMLIAIMSLGSRGPLVGILSFAMIAFIKINHEKKRDVRIILGFLVGLIFVFFSGSLFTLLYNLLYSIGIDSRTLIMIANHNIGYMSGRDELYEFFLQEIVSNPFIIRGINRDQALGFNYPHNVFLELLYQLGIILGGLIVVSIVFKAFKALKSKCMSTDSKQQLEIIFMCVSLSTLMISGTLWKQINFWIWIAISNNKYRDYKRKIREGT